MIQRLLIANRGEIACRIIRTAKRLGIHTIAIYSEIDANAQHVLMADEAYCIGAPSPAESYLAADKVLDIAVVSRADAVHPGYGFLSENAAFSRACETAGILFVGPQPAAIEAMGSKSHAKATMQAAGVPVVPGYHGKDQDEATLFAAANNIGYPVLLKAAAGGGGKGMRRVDNVSQFHEALASAKREASASFGDDHMLIEKCLLTPRHIEVQLMCDKHGNAIYVGDRDCSVQRRHQKIIEEAPAPGLSDALRQAMGEAAVAAAKAIQYSGAGTIEFLYQDEAFYFMEMNTRLQVEHPVSEAISGLDLVELQLRVAAGEPLPLAQSDVVLKGHAIELRVYAEDTDNGFLPAAGRLEVYREACAEEGLRIDSGVVEGDVISPYYDPMIAKIIAYGEHRGAAMAKARRALTTFALEGFSHNLDFLYHVLVDEAFISGAVSTAFLEQRLDLLSTWRESLPIEVVVSLYQVLMCHTDSLWHARPHFRMNLPPTSQHVINGGLWKVEQHTNVWRVFGQDSSWDVQVAGHQQRLVVNHQGVVSTFLFIPCQEGVRVFAARSASYVRWPLPDWQDHDAADDGAMLAPMNGRVLACCVIPGDTVTLGQTLLVMEAMKMEYTLKAPSDGVVLGFKTAPGELVEGGQLLIDFKAVESVS
jgi:3-methylcrotonyl-CoA carboxylase alpha subunit